MVELTVVVPTFDRATVLYGRTVAGLLRVSAIVLLLYGGLLFLTYRTMAAAPVGAAVKEA